MTDPGLLPEFLTDYYSNLQPNSSVAAEIMSTVKPGYRFYKLERQKHIAKVTYKRYP